MCLCCTKLQLAPCGSLIIHGQAQERNAAAPTKPLGWPVTARDCIINGLCTHHSLETRQSPDHRAVQEGCSKAHTPTAQTDTPCSSWPHSSSSRCHPARAQISTRAGGCRCCWCGGARSAVRCPTAARWAGQPVRGPGAAHTAAAAAARRGAAGNRCGRRGAHSP